MAMIKKQLEDNEIQKKAMENLYLENYDTNEEASEEDSENEDEDSDDTIMVHMDNGERIKGIADRLYDRNFHVPARQPTSNSGEIGMPSNLSGIKIPWLSEEQMAIFKVYEQYLQNPLQHDFTNGPPLVNLLTGMPGTGKSILIHALSNHAENCGTKIIKTSYNNSNASDIGGPTLVRLTKLNLNVHMKNETLDFTDDTFGIGDSKLVVIDEISNVPAYVLNRLDSVMKQATGNSQTSFGGIPILMVGDFCQLPPVKQNSILRDLLDLLNENK
jgi:hypothetical protein